MDNSIIEVDNITKFFGSVTAIEDLSFEVREGEIFGFLGHNGAGKTTTVRLLNGILAPDNGSIRVLDLDPKIDGATLRSHTGVLTESASLDLRLSALDNLLIYADIFSIAKENTRERVDLLLDTFDLSEFATKKVSTFSTGMRQRLALARTLLHQPKILFLDEPTAGLDPIVSRQVHNLILQLAKEQGRTIFLCTHNLYEAQHLCNRVAVMEHGHLAAIGTPAELINSYIQNIDVDIHIDPQQTALAIDQLKLRRIPIKKILNDQDGKLSVTVDGFEAIPNLINNFVNNDIRIYHIAAHEPSLEDVYFALHAEEEKNK